MEAEKGLKKAEKTEKADFEAEKDASSQPDESGTAEDAESGMVMTTTTTTVEPKCGAETVCHHQRMASENSPVAVVGLLASRQDEGDGTEEV